MKSEGTMILKHECKKWKQGMKKPKIISDKKDWGYIKCSLCKENVGGRLQFK